MEPSTTPIRSLAIRTSFRHHAEHAGYKQILKYTNPVSILGIDENSALPGVLKRKYQWLYEFEAYFKFRNKIDVLHILYGEDYFRFSTCLFKNTPVVASFHQPPELLEREVLYGSFRGKVARITHYMSYNRFKKLAAAIVMDEAQKDILKKMMSEEKIYVLPLGTNLRYLNAKLNTYSDLINPDSKVILTVGNWLRDWDFYFHFISYCSVSYPDWKFILVNKNLSPAHRALVQQNTNLTYAAKISDNELFKLYISSKVLFLPLLSAAGNNSLIEGIALGCPVVMSNVVNEKSFIDEDFVSFYTKNNVNEATVAINGFMKMDRKSFIDVRKHAIDFSKQFDWESIANKTLDIYRSVI